MLAKLPHRGGVVVCLFSLEASGRFHVTVHVSCVVGVLVDAVGFPMWLLCSNVNILFCPVLVCLSVLGMWLMILVWLDRGRADVVMVSSVREQLKKKGLIKPLEVAFRKMQIVQRNVRGSETERDVLLPKFFALRLWSGCASLFFTLNPHDIRSPMVIALLQDDMRWERKFSLDLSDEETAEYMRSFLQENPRKLHEAVAANPLVATRVFHWTVRMVIRTLFNCADKPGSSPDSIAASETPGVFGHVRAYLGVVEPQMRKALHIHMLIQLLGFSHPQDLFGSEVLPNVFKRLWYFVASVCFRSTEAFANHLGCASAMTALREEPLLPLSKKQKGMIGETRSRECMQAQLTARGLNDSPQYEGLSKPVSYAVSTSHGNSSVGADQWARACIGQVAASTRKTGNHVCRADVCHKGAVGRKGFCRTVDGKCVSFFFLRPTLNSPL